MMPVSEPSKKLVPLFDREKRSCQIIILNVVPLYDVNPLIINKTKICFFVDFDWSSLRLPTELAVAVTCLDYDKPCRIQSKALQITLK